MKALIQRVKTAKVLIDGSVYSEINEGLLVFLGVEKADNQEDIFWLCKKIRNLRIFPDENDKMNYSLLDIGGEVLIVSQFTLPADCRKGNRPSFDNSEDPVIAKQMYEDFITELSVDNVKVKTGVFGAMMDIELTNWGPVTFMLEHKSGMNYNEK